MRRISLVSAALALATTTLPAQGRARGRVLELRPMAGIFVPLGAQRSDFKAATMLGGQAAIELLDNVHALASLGWTHGHNRFFTNDVTHIWQYDVGAELNLARAIGPDVVWRPFLGAGAGGRSYDYRVASVTTKRCLAGYGTLGSELQGGVVALRAEARSYLTCFESPITGEKHTRNDLALSVGLAYHLR